MCDLVKLWDDIPIGRDNAITYLELCFKWDCNKRKVRSILHKLSGYDSGDKFILIRSSKGKGFYKTDDVKEIEQYKKECMNRARHTFIPLRKINRVLDINDNQVDMFEDIV